MTNCHSPNPDHEPKRPENSMSTLQTRPDHESTRTEHHVRTLPRPDQMKPQHPQLASAGIETAAATRRYLHPTLFDRAVWRLVSVGGFDGELAVKGSRRSVGVFGALLPAAHVGHTSDTDATRR